METAFPGHEQGRALEPRLHQAVQVRADGFVGRNEMRLEIRGSSLLILRVWHTLEVR